MPINIGNYKERMKHDNDAISQFKMEFFSSVQESTPIVTPYVTYNQVITRDSSKGEILFQFPPRILNESKASRWNEQDLYTYEPLAIYMGADNRQISINFEYVVNGSTWTSKKVSDQVRTLKGMHYFGDVRPKYNDATKVIYIKLHAYEVVPLAGGTPSTWRLLRTSINYSEEMIKTDDLVWPLHTKVTVDLAMLTKAAYKVATQNNGNIQYVQNFAVDIPDKVEPEWY